MSTGKPQKAGSNQEKGYKYFIFGVVTGCMLYGSFSAISLNTSWSHGRVSSSPVDDNVGGNRLLSVIVTSVSQELEVSEMIGRTWGAHSTYRVATGGGEEIQSNIFLLAKRCGDFPSGAAPSPKQMFCLLQVIHDSYINLYQWFLIGSVELYVAIPQLERYLNQLNPYSLLYLGRPQYSALFHGHYCLGGPGVILSKVLLQQLVFYLQTCANQDSAGNWDLALGRCLGDKLQVTCRTSDEATGRFIWNKGPSIKPLQLQTDEKFSNMLTFYPIIDSAHMNVVHYVAMAREAAYHQSRANAFRHLLNSSQTCTNSSSACIYVPEGKEIMIQNYTRLTRCPKQSSGGYHPAYARRKEEVLDWETIEGNYIYTSHSTAAAVSLFGERKSELNLVVEKAVEVINQASSIGYKLGRIISAHVRYRGSVGNEFILDLELSGGGKKIKRRVSLIRPHTFQVRVIEDAPSKLLDKTIDFVVPLSNVNNRFGNFIKNYEDVCIKTGEACRLNLVVYGTEDVNRIRTQMEALKKKYPKFLYKVIPGQGKFSRAPSLDQGMAVLESSDLAFVCDVDMSIGQTFLDRCRQNTIQGKRVYFPTIFKFYNMDYVNWGTRNKVSYSINSQHGHWGTYGYGMMCIYKSDYSKIGGYNKKIRGWGGEDYAFTDLTVKKKYEIFRAIEPSLSHHWHPKNCDGLSRWQHSSCLSSRSLVLAGRGQLAMYIDFLEKKCGVRNGPARH